MFVVDDCEDITFVLENKPFIWVASFERDFNGFVNATFKGGFVPACEYVTFTYMPFYSIF